MKSGFFIMQLWQTGNIGSNNIAKIEANPKDGYESQGLARTAMINLDNEGKLKVHGNKYTYTIMELFW